MDRQSIIETNRSLRLIKNELETLIEKGVLDDDAYGTIMNILPAESPLSGATAAPAKAKASTPVPAEKAVAPPPAYSQTGPPALPNRNPPPPAPAAKPVLAHARALYPYQGADARDVSFEKDDRIAVHEYMNNDWWMGKNLRTGDEGIFPRTYVQIDESEKAWPANPNGPAAPVNPYNSYAPPMAIASDGGQDSSGSSSKMGEHGKKFGKKLGNAAVFGAGATIGSNIVNSIF